MVNEIITITEKGKGVFNKSAWWVFKMNEKVLLWDDFLTDLKFVIESPKYKGIINAKFTDDSDYGTHYTRPRGWGLYSIQTLKCGWT